MIARTLLAVKDITLTQTTKRRLALKVTEPGRVFTEEERSRVPRCLRCCGRSPRCSSHSRMPISASTAPSATTSPSSSTPSTVAERKESQRDLVLYLPDEILVVDHHSAKAWNDRYDFSGDG